jgi:hypothetical protein
LECVKEIHLKLGKCEKKNQKKDGKHIELVLMNLRTPFDVFVLSFHTNYKELQEYGKDYTFEDLCASLITNQHKLLEEGKLGGKH